MTRPTNPSNSYASDIADIKHGAFQWERGQRLVTLEVLAIAAGAGYWAKSWVGGLVVFFVVFMLVLYSSLFRKALAYLVALITAIVAGSMGVMLGMWLDNTNTSAFILAGVFALLAFSSVVSAHKWGYLATKHNADNGERDNDIPL